MTDTPDDSHAAAAFDALARRARRSGYRLERVSGSVPGWELLDAADGDRLHATSSLADIASYLDE